MYRAAEHALATGKPTVIVTKDNDVLEQSHRPKSAIFTTWTRLVSTASTTGSAWPVMPPQSRRHAVSGTHLARRLTVPDTQLPTTLSITVGLNDLDKVRLVGVLALPSSDDVEVTTGYLFDPAML